MCHVVSEMGERAVEEKLESTVIRVHCRRVRVWGDAHLSDEFSAESVTHDVVDG